MIAATYIQGLFITETGKAITEHSVKQNLLD